MGGSLRVVTVPWIGKPGRPPEPHPVFDGGTLILQGVAFTAPMTPLMSATWDPGDGTGPQPISVANPRVLELAHVYNGLDFQPYTAVLTVTDTDMTAVSDTFRVIVRPRTLDVDVNMAIDRGLWNLHRNQILSSSGMVPTGFWTTQDITAATASAVLAFEASGHYENGTPDEDPYVDDVKRGLAHLMTALCRVDIGMELYGDPDTNGNNFGLVSIGLPIYVGGQVVDAIVASNTPDAITATGEPGDVLGRTYRMIVEDMMDAFAWSQAESESAFDGFCFSTYNPRGGWRYGLNDQQADNSASQWVAIAGLAAERAFGVFVPPFVKAENANHFLPNTQIFDGSNAGADGHFGYTLPGCSPDLFGINTTPSGLVQLDFDGVPSSDPRYVASVGFMIRNWSTLIDHHRIYGMFALAKAMRLAQGMPIELMNGTFDWYKSDTTSGDPINGLARHLVNTQAPDGSWCSPAWVCGDLASAWALVILSPTIFQPPPIAVCEVDAEVTGVNVPIEFDGSGSFHLDPARSIVSYEWDFDGDMVFDASGKVVTHAFTALGTYDVTLRVTDDNTPPLIDSDTCPILVEPPPNRPDSNPGGAYHFCLGFNEPFLLDGTGSFDPDGMIVSYGWDFTDPIDTFTDATTPTVDVTAFYTALGPGMYNVGLQVVDNDGIVNTDFTTVEVRADGIGCEECVTLDFETEDDFLTPLGNGQKIDVEFGRLVSISGAGRNAGPATFDTTPGGPNDPALNGDMLIGHGNVLLLEDDWFSYAQTVPGFFDVVTDDRHGGDLIFDFTSPVDPRSMLLVDINPPPNRGASVTLIDETGLTRIYAIDPGWTGTYGNAGPHRLDLTTLDPQPGNGTQRFALATEMQGFQHDRVVRMVVHMTGNGAMDELHFCR